MPFVRLLDEADWTKLRANRYVSLLVPEDIWRKVQCVYQLGEHFFDITLEEKLIDRFPENAGYRPYGIERSRTMVYRDEIESFSITHKVPTPAQHGSAEATELSKAMVEAFEALEPLAESLISQFASRVMKVNPERFCGMLHKWSYLQLNRRHMAQNGPSGGFTSDVHEDACVFTIMSNTGPGLEIEDSNGNFVPVRPERNQLILFPGSVLSLLSGGTFPPTYHRVRAVPGEDKRKALLFFAELDATACDPWIINETNEGISIKDFILNSPTHHGLQAWSSDH